MGVIGRIRETVRVARQAVDGSIVDHGVTDGERFTLLLPGCHWVAAPVIMFRLKRLGYSAVRVTSSDGGLTVSWRR